MTTATIERVHSQSGRIDAKLVAELYDLKLAKLAEILGESPETLRKDVDRDEAQPGLAKLVHAWNELEGILANDDHIRRWLHHPLPKDGRRPLDLLLGKDGLKQFTRLIGRIATGGFA
ncbi:MAG: hypothetical protein ABI282_08765 [Candidatus Baltobacteraceae bacterium]